jgi:hypothetical protein
VKSSKKMQNNSADIWERKLQRSKTTHMWIKLSFTESHYEKKDTTQRKCKTDKKIKIII